MEALSRTLFWFGYLMSNRASNHGTGGRPQKTTSDRAACHAAYDSAGCGAFFLLGHSGACTQSQGCYQQSGRAAPAHTVREVHDNFSNQT
jgi:hypothetical protein